MTRYAIIVAVLMLFFAPAAEVAAKDRHEVGIVPRDSTAPGDRTKEYACDCCQKCKAAKSSIESEEDKKDKEGDGCAGCCARCGRKLQPATEEHPPEIIEKRTPPDIEEKK